MAPIRVRFSPGFLLEQDLPGSNLIRADHVLQRGVRRSTPLRSASPLEQPPQKIHPGEELLRSSRSTLEQIPPQESRLLVEILG
jgi:hypothetical protein